MQTSQDYARAVGLDGAACVHEHLRSFGPTEAVRPSSGESAAPRPTPAIAIANVLAVVLGLAVIAVG